ncbi:tRNA pseudouridine(55) synthase TruB [Patescibacteria group bacterium]
MKYKLAIFAVNKPKGLTSRQVVNKIQKETGIKKVGHAGTLDPLASGVLVIGVGREATKKLSLEVVKEKEYIAKIKLGKISTTDDSEGEKTTIKIDKIPKKDEIENKLNTFSGEIMQTPPLYSAVKVKGKEAYKLARKGKTFRLKPRKVYIKEIEIIEYKWPTLKLRIITGPGVYIRSIARDLGGYMTDLQRIRVGNFKLKDAYTLTF